MEKIKTAHGKKVGELCLTFSRSRLKAMYNKVGRVFMTILQKRTFFSLLVFDKILINSSDSKYWEVNPPDQEIKIY